jgi:tetratricopeptide (TPR) repeat protein
MEIFSSQLIKIRGIFLSGNLRTQCKLSILPPPPPLCSVKAFCFSSFGMLIVCLVAISGAGCSKQARINRYLAKANRDYQAEQYDRAEIEYLTVLKLAPLDPTAIARLGIIYHLQGKHLPAFTYLRKAVELDPNNLDARLKLGLLYSAVHKPKDARSEAMRVLEKQPWNEDALLLLSDSAADSQDANQILQLIDGYRQRDKDRAAYHLVIGAMHLRQQNLDKAESELKQAVALDPKSAATYLVLGNLYLLKNDLTQAEQALKMSSDLSPWHSARKLSYADFKLKTGAPDEAKRIAEGISQKAPDYIPAWLFLVQIEAGVRHFEDCDRLLERILARDPSNYQALILKGNLLMSQGDGTNAVAHLERLTTIYKGDPQAFAQLAIAHLMNLDVAKARSSLNQALVANPNFADATLLLAELDIRQRKAPVAIASIQKLIEQQPELVRAHLLLADAYLRQYDSQSATAVYRHMMELFPQDPQVPLLLGIQLTQQSQFPEARRAFEKSLEIAPDSISAFEQLVNLDIAEKQFNAATEHVKLRMEKTPRSANPWLLFAKIHLAQNEADKAEVALSKAIELEPDLRNPYLLLADIYRTSNRREQALQKLNALLAKNANDPAALLQVGLIENALTNFPAARDAYERLLTINPKSNVALNNLACLYGEHLGQLNKAYELACKGRRLYPSDPFTGDTLGWILYKRGDYLHALGSLQESARYLTAEPEVQFHLGMAYYMMGDEDIARAALQVSTQSTNNFNGKAEASRRLAVLAIDPTTANHEVVADLESKLRADPRDPIMFSRLADIHQRDGHFREAEQSYEQALKLSPQNSLMMIRLAQLVGDQLGDLPKALKLAKEAHNLAPDNPRISYSLGRLALRTGDQKWALSLIRDAASRLPPDPDVQYDLGLASYSVGEIERARIAVQNAVEIDSPFAKLEGAKAFLSLTEGSRDSRDIANKTALAQQVLKTDPKNIAALLVIARAEEHQQNYANAKKVYETILESAPLFTPATKNLALLCAEHLGEDQRAYELASKVRESCPDDLEVARLLGILTYRLGKDNSDFARSARLLRESAVKRTDDSELFYYLGLAEYKTNQFQECKKALQRALVLNLQAKFADNARQVLAKLN